MPIKCVIKNCRNTNASLHEFPKDASRRKKKMGFAKTLYLKPDAVPTIQEDNQKIGGFHRVHRSTYPTGICASLLRALSSASSGEDMETEPVMDGTDDTQVELRSCFIKSEVIEESIERKNGCKMSREEELILSNMKEEEEDGGERQREEAKREDGVKDEEVDGYEWKQDREGDEVISESSQTDQWLRIEGIPECQKQEEESSSSLVTSCLLQQTGVPSPGSPVTSSKEIFEMSRLRSCPLCSKLYRGLSRHLRVFHGVRNLQERKLLLSLNSGRVYIHSEACAISGCGSIRPRLDRRVSTRIELSVGPPGARNDVMRKVVVRKLAELRASRPAVPMTSSFDLDAARQESVVFGGAAEDAPVPADDECQSEACKRQRQSDLATIAALGARVDQLKDDLRGLSKRYRLLSRRARASHSLRDKSLRALLESD